jgi:hypothetical protein
MKVYLKKESERLQPWKVLSIAKRPEQKGIEVTFTGSLVDRYSCFQFFVVGDA